ncbi:fasciclin domain-containing protein [uncultured Fibrella sp.]|uniref:fasciclin domain-containing protein n=1 Tax=uncultured Fibrella sp. TaxID=1284596 RepID=UPI0035C95190
MKKFTNSLLLTFVILLPLVYLIGCREQDFVQTTTSDVNMFSYLKTRPDSFSEFTAILDKAGYEGFLDAYGAYTMFVPTNAGVQTYLKSIDKTAASLSKEEAQNIAKIHIIRDTLTTKSFKDGKLPLVTMYGQYLLGGVSFANGTSSYSLNRQALVLETNITTSNGIVHVIDNVLKPATMTLAATLEKNPAYSIFTEAIKQTGYYDSLNVVLTDPDRRWTTVLAESNTALGKAGFTSFDALKKRYSKTGNPRLKTDSLNLYVAYHMLPGAKYLADIITAQSHTTKVPLEVVTSKLDGQTVLINDDDFNGVHEQGVELERPISDIAATNGVIHSSTGHFVSKVRKPTPVYWDVADFPEIRKLPAYFGKKSYDFIYGSVKDINWERSNFNLSYSYNTASNFACFKNDYLMIPLGAPNRSIWVDLKTPMLVKGRYKVWVCYRFQKQSGGSINICQGSVDGETLPRPMAFTDTAPAGSEGELEALGWKLYSDPGTDRNLAGRLLGIIDIKTTDRHTFRLTCISGTQNNNNLDMVHFIPIDMPQTRPRFNRNGTLVP